MAKVCGIACFRQPFTKDFTATVNGRISQNNGGDGDVSVPTHLVVTVNGIFGSADDWRYAAMKFVERYPEVVTVHCSESNHSMLTRDGIDVMGQRLAKEVSSVVARRPELQKISFVCHSLGGLVARYAIAVLYTQSDQWKENENCKICEFDSKKRCSEHKPKGKISGLDPINFITFATPHLGSRFHKQIPLFSASRIFEKLGYHSSWIAGRTGKQLYLKDHVAGRPPLLIQMVNDCADSKFISALQSFERRVAYANVDHDFAVGWRTASIRRKNELPKRQNLMKNDKYPHIVFEDKKITVDFGEEKSVGIVVTQPRSTEEKEEAMIIGLNRVTWERIDVSFHHSKQRFFAHSTIQVKSYKKHSDGADVIAHMLDNFVL